MIHLMMTFTPVEEAGIIYGNLIFLAVQNEQLGIMDGSPALYEGLRKVENMAQWWEQPM